MSLLCLLFTYCSSHAQGNALDFSGSGYISVPHDLDLALTNQFTLELWIKPAGSGERPILEKYNATIGFGGYSLRLTAGNQVELTIYNGLSTNTVVSTTVLTNGEWVHLAAIFDGGSDELKIMIDGETDATNGSALLTPLVSLASLLVGAKTTDNSINFEGEMDEISIWNVVRTEADVRTDMYLLKDGTETGLAGCWQNDESSGAIIDMISSFTGAINGTINRVTSNIPAGIGVSSRIGSVTAGNNIFGSTGLSVNVNGLVGAMEMVVTRIDRAPRGTQPSDDFPALTATYPSHWIIRNFGVGTYTSADISADLGGSGLISSADASTPSNLKLLRRGDNSTGSWTMPVAAVTADATNGTLTYDPITSFGMMQVGTTGNSPLPVEWLSVGVDIDEKGNADIQWQVSNEYQVASYEIEYAMDGASFQKNGNSIAANNLSGVQHYNTRIQLDQSGLYYFRVKQTDFDGQFTYSEIKVASWNSREDQPIIFPNPVSDQLFVKLNLSSPNNVNVTIADIHGKAIINQTRQLGVGIHTINLPIKRSDLPSGTYHLSIQTGTISYNSLIISSN